MPRFKKALLLPEQAAPGTPAAGNAAVYTTDGTTLLMKNDAGNVITVGPGAGGGGSSSAEYTVTTDHTTTTPTAPATGVTLFARHRARRLLAGVGPSGLDTQYQPALFSNRIGRLTAINATAAPQADALVAPTNYTTAPSAITAATTNFYTSMIRTRYPSATTAGAFAGFRLTNPQWFLSSTPNMGGFFWVFRFGQAAGTATARAFVGLAPTTTNDTNADATSLTNHIGFFYNSTGTYSTNWCVLGGTPTDLGASFPARTYATNFFEFRLFAPSGGGQTVYWSALRLNDGAFVQGTQTTSLPGIGVMLTHHSWINNVTAALAALEFQSLYVETDN